MTERHGLYTLQFMLALTSDGRDRLTQLARSRPHADLADLVTELLVTQQFDQPPVETALDAAVHVPVRVYLSAEQRDALAARTDDPAALISQIVAAALTEMPPIPAPPPAPGPTIDRQRLRAALVQLRDRRSRDGDDAPAWIDPYIAQLEEQLRGL